MKRILLALLTATLLAGVALVPAFASTSAQETVYYTNDFSDAETDNRCYLGNGTISNGTLKYYRGGGVVFTDEYTSSLKNAQGVKVYNAGEEKPDVKVEFSITMPTYTSAFANNARYVTSCFNTYFYGIDTVDISTYNIWPSKKGDKEHYTKGTDNALLTDEDKVYGKTYNIKILYSSKEDIKTIYINDVCLGTYNVNTNYYSWKNDETGYFKLGFTFAGTNTASWNVEGREITLDNVKISKIDDKMISVPVDFESSENLLTIAHANSLWVPEGEQVILNAKPANGKTLSILINEDLYIDSFSTAVEYKTPVLKEDDAISIITRDKDMNFAAYTMPYSYQYVKEDGAKAAVVLGRMVEVDGYSSNSFGIFYSMSDSNVTVNNEGVYPLRLKNDNPNVIDGHFAIEMFSKDLKAGDVIYYKAYAYYTNNDNADDKVQSFGEVKTIVIE